MCSSKRYYRRGFVYKTTLLCSLISQKYLYIYIFTTITAFQQFHNSYIKFRTKDNVVNLLLLFKILIFVYFRIKNN